MPPRQVPAAEAAVASRHVATPPVLSVQGLHFAWPGRTLFEDMNFALDPGVSLVCGDEGCGKSTLLRLLAGDCAAQSGQFRLRGLLTDLQSESHRQQVFWIDPKSDIHDAGTATDFLNTARHLHPAFSGDALAELVAGFGLEPHLSKPMYMLSAGSKRKVWLSAAFAARTPLTLIDQPFAALDGPSIRFLTSLLQEAASQSQRAWLLADYEAPPGVPLACTIHC